MTYQDMSCHVTTCHITTCQDMPLLPMPPSPLTHITSHLSVTTSLCHLSPALISLLHSTLSFPLLIPPLVIPPFNAFLLFSHNPPLSPSLPPCFFSLCLLRHGRLQVLCGGLRNRQLRPGTTSHHTSHTTHHNTQHCTALVASILPSPHPLSLTHLIPFLFLTYPTKPPTSPRSQHITQHNTLHCTALHCTTIFVLLYPNPHHLTSPSLVTPLSRSYISPLPSYILYLSYISTSVVRGLDQGTHGRPALRGLSRPSLHTTGTITNTITKYHNVPQHTTKLTIYKPLLTHHPSHLTSSCPM